MTTQLDLVECLLDGVNLIEASAGTGKTWNICGLYLRLLLERKLPVQQILVVTFTIAATAELRERIRLRIVEALSYASGSAVSASISATSASGIAASAAGGAASASGGAASAAGGAASAAGGAASASDGATSASGDVFVSALVEGLIRGRGYTREQIIDRLDLALQTFDEASIFTIHGFCQRALADTAFSAGLPFEFELVTDDNEIIVEAINDFWRCRVAGEDFSPSLAAFMMERREKDSPQTFARLLARHTAKPLARSIWPVALDEPEPANVDISALEAAFGSARAAWIAGKTEVHDRITQGLPVLNAGSYKPESLDKAVIAWDRYFTGSNPLAVIDEKATLFCASVLKKRTNAKAKQSTPTHPFCDHVDELLGLQTAAREALTVARLRLIRTLIDEVGADLPRRKRERRVIAFNDMLSNLHTALHDKRYPWLADSLRRRFPAALIDEFQDTDPLQFAIFDSIYGNGDGSLFLVGDPKQAIYSFRNADLYTYLDARKRATARYTLSRNQRSTPGLIAAVNGLFEANGRAFMLPDLEYQAFSSGERQRDALNDISLDLSANALAAPSVATEQRPDTSVSHPAALASHPDATTPRPDLHIWMLPDPPIHRSVVRTRAVQATAAEIARLLNESNAGRIDIGGVPLRPRDIAILVRSHAQGSELKRELATLNIGSVELLQESVFASVDAEDVERVLMAIVDPSRLTLLRAALATEMIGYDAAAIVTLSGDETQLHARIEGFAAYREAWLHKGVGVMFRELLTKEGASARLLCKPDGERRLTNLLHLGEELHKAAQIHDSPDALLRWLQSQRRDVSAAEATQLRLESDQNLVQIVTIHKAKGLEWPIVFCPFLWDGYLMPRRSGDGREYHDADGTALIDFRTGSEFEPHDAGYKAQVKLEDSAELLRLAYVALTRAVYRCYLIAGTYSTHRAANPSMTQSCGSLLNWLVAGNGQAPQTWFGGKEPPANIAAAWSTLAAARRPHIGLVPLPDIAGTPVALVRPGADSLVALTPPARIANAWRMNSFSGLASGASNEAAATDHDARSASVARVIGLPPASVAPDDILRFARGSNAGDCLHAVFERIDFTDASTWDDCISRALSLHPQPLPDARSPVSKDALAAMIAKMLADVIATPLPSGIKLGSIPSQKRLTELEFNFSARDVSTVQLDRTLAQLGYTVQRLAYGNLEGYLKGFIDLVFEDGGRFYILDWKSNHLGYTAEDYGRESMEASMVEHGYHLQYLIYSIALDRYLAHRMAEYDYERNFGGVLYLFIRGVRPDWMNADGTPTGIYAHRPAKETLEQFDRLLSDGARKRSA